MTTSQPLTAGLATLADFLYPTCHHFAASQAFFSRLSTHLVPLRHAQVLKAPGIVESVYGWSYWLAWVGVGQCLVASVIFLAAARCIRREKRDEQAKNMQVRIPLNIRIQFDCD